MSKCAVCKKKALDENNLRAMVNVCAEHYKILKAGEEKSDSYFKTRSRRNVPVGSSSV